MQTSDMMKSRFTDEQIIGFLKQVEAEAALQGARAQARVQRRFHLQVARLLWRDGRGGRSRLRELEGDNGELERVLADVMLKTEALKVVARSKR
jgi:putative transposase